MISFFFSSRRRHTRCSRDWSSDVCSSDLYNDATSLAQLPARFAYQPAALVLTRLVSRPRGGVVTCDAGHKAVSADAGVPTCLVLGHRELTPLSPSEEIGRAHV